MIFEMAKKVQGSETMKRVASLLVFTLGLCAMSHAATAQQARKSRKPSASPTIASIMNAQLTMVEQQFVGAAEAMPADKYSFAPSASMGKYAGVRTFAQEVKHVATANYYFYSAILGQPVPVSITANKQNNGPDSILTKEQIIKYLKDSFALGHRAMATLTPRNATLIVSNPPVPFLNTRLSLASFGCTHAFDHYGQMVEYLRMNGITPPASQGQPPANPSRAD
jgi:uncharacterized damage-inducible protein DinB